MSLTLRLPEQKNYSVTVDLKLVLTYFGDTIIGDALRFDPETTTLDFVHHVMTPQVLDELKIIIDNEQIPSEFKALGSAWNYLGGKLIPVVTNRQFRPDLLKHLNPTTIRADYRDLMEQASNCRFYELIEYIGSHVRPDAEITRIDSELLSETPTNWDDFEWYVRYFIGRE